MKKRRALTVFAVVVSVVFVMLCGLYAFGKSYFTDARVYEINWGIELPSGITELYSAGSEPSFHGDGFDYTVYEYDGGSGEFNAELSSGHDAGVESAVGEILDALAVPDDERPDFSETYSLMALTDPNDTRNHLYVLYFAGSNRLYLAEVTM